MSCNPCWAHSPPTQSITQSLMLLRLNSFGQVLPIFFFIVHFLESSKSRIIQMLETAIRLTFWIIRWMFKAKLEQILVCIFISSLYLSLTFWHTFRVVVNTKNKHLHLPSHFLVTWISFSCSWPEWNDFSRLSINQGCCWIPSGYFSYHGRRFYLQFNYE